MHAREWLIQYIHDCLKKGKKENKWLKYCIKKNIRTNPIDKSKEWGDYTLNSWKFIKMYYNKDEFSSWCSR
jgi:hypothetical protein